MLMELNQEGHMIALYNVKGKFWYIYHIRDLEPRPLPAVYFNQTHQNEAGPDFNQVRADGYHIFSCFNASIMFSFFTLAPEYSMAEPTMTNTATMTDRMLIHGRVNP